MSRYKTRAAIGMLVAAMAIGGPAMAKDRDPGQDRGSRLKTVRVSGSSDVDLRAATNVSVKCLPSGTCLVIGYNTSLLTGDISGNLTYGFVVSQSAQGGSFNTGQYEVTGTVKGCGTGTFVVAYRPTYLDRTLPPTFDQNGNTTFAPGSAEIIRGLRTGDLGDLEGEFLLSLIPTGPTTFTVKYSGVVRCARHGNNKPSDNNSSDATTSDTSAE